MGTFVANAGQKPDDPALAVLAARKVSLFDRANTCVKDSASCRSLFSTFAWLALLKVSDRLVLAVM